MSLIFYSSSSLVSSHLHSEQMSLPLTSEITEPIRQEPSHLPTALHLAMCSDFPTLTANEAFVHLSEPTPPLTLHPSFLSHQFLPFLDYPYLLKITCHSISYFKKSFNQNLLDPTFPASHLPIFSLPFISKLCFHTNSNGFSDQPGSSFCLHLLTWKLQVAETRGHLGASCYY